MKNIKKILTVIDDSELSRDILKKSIELAKRFDAKIILLNTIHIPLFNLPTFKSELPIDRESVKESIDKIFDDLNSEAGVEYHTLVYFGDRSQRAIIEAKRDDIDIIVTGSGVQYEKLIREIQKPLLIVKESYREYKDILIPTDLSRKSKESIAFIKDNFDANLSLVYGYESIVAVTSMYDISYIDMVDYQKENREIALALLQEFEKDVGIGGELADASFSLSNGILEYIENKNPDLVLVASHSRDESLFIGSIASYLAKESPVDILIFC